MQGLLETLGGLGLFLFGMSTMTSGLRELAGDRLRHWLSRSTRTPFSGMVSGALTTAIVQSSSATTVAVVGFVGAGLLTFTQALGVIFGANIGTTITGWMVALIGFKLKLSTMALPLLFVAGILCLFKQKRTLRGTGKALAGFCLIFLGISYLQEGLAGYRDAFDLSGWSIDHLGGRLLLVLIGCLLTFVTQSSSATVATALTALNASVLTLPQAAAVIIGADIGTTVTAALATIGGTTASKRTGFAHVIYNVLTGVVAFLVLPLYLWAVTLMAPEWVSGSQEMVAVSFHTFFNVFGVVLGLPLIGLFAKGIVRLFPEQTPALIASFNQQLLSEPPVAVDALWAGTRQLAEAAVDRTTVAVSPTATGEASQVNEPEVMMAAVEVARDFALRIGQRTDEGDAEAERVFAALHAVDHIERLVERLDAGARAQRAMLQPEFADLARRVGEGLRRFSEALKEEEIAVDVVRDLEQLAAELEQDRAGFRTQWIRRATAEQLSSSALDEVLDSHRWLRRTVYHVSRMAHYLRA